MVKGKTYILRGDLKTPIKVIKYPRTRSNKEAEKRYTKLKKLGYKPSKWKSADGYSVEGMKDVKKRRKK